MAALTVHRKRAGNLPAHVVVQVPVLLSDSPAREMAPERLEKRERRESHIGRPVRPRPGSVRKRDLRRSPRIDEYPGLSWPSRAYAGIGRIEVPSVPDLLVVVALAACFLRREGHERPVVRLDEMTGLVVELEQVDRDRAAPVRNVSHVLLRPGRPCPGGSGQEKEDDPGPSAAPVTQAAAGRTARILIRVNAYFVRLCHRDLCCKFTR